MPKRVLTIREKTELEQMADQFAVAELTAVPEHIKHTDQGLQWIFDMMRVYHTRMFAEEGDATHGLPSWAIAAHGYVSMRSWIMPTFWNTFWRDAFVNVRVDNLVSLGWDRRWNSFLVTYNPEAIVRGLAMQAVFDFQVPLPHKLFALVTLNGRMGIVTPIFPPVAIVIEGGCVDRPTDLVMASGVRALTSVDKRD